MIANNEKSEKRGIGYNISAEF